MHEAEEISGARFLWQPNIYDLVMLDVRRYSSEDTQRFSEEIKAASPRQQFAFVMGSPHFLLRTWPGELTADDTSRGQGGETVKRFLAVA